MEHRSVSVEMKYKIEAVYEMAEKRNEQPFQYLLKDTHFSTPLPLPLDNPGGDFIILVD